MTQSIVITGTDTGIGKTVVAAMLTRALGASYWKPVQAGLDGRTDRAMVADLAGLGGSRVIPEAYRLTQPLSPHLAAELDGVTIEPERLQLPKVAGPVIVEGAGGVLVPLTRTLVYADIFAQWRLPVILCARTALGTINHSLLSLEALRQRGCNVHGVIFVGEEMADSQRTICEMGPVPSLGRLPWLAEVTGETLSEAFDKHFAKADFL